MRCVDSLRLKLQILTALIVVAASFSVAAVDQTVHTYCADPPIECRPRTYWFWPGSAVTRDEVTSELQQRHEGGGSSR